MAAPAPLRRVLGPAGVLFLTLSVATPASSVFVIVPGMLQVAGTGALAALGLAGVVCVATALIYAELASAFPDAGGEYVMAARTLGPAAGYAMLVVNVFNNLLYPPVAALGLSAVLAGVVPGLPAVPVAIAAMAAATLLALLDVRVGALVTGVFLAIEVAALVAVAALGLAHATRPILPMLAHPVAAAAAGLVPATPAAIGVATTIAIFALNGYGAAIYFAEEMQAPRIGIARVILAALAAILMLEAVPVVAALAGAPDLATLLRADDPFGLLARARGGPAGAIAIGVAVAIVNAVVAGVLATARFGYASARDASWGRPLDRALAAIHPRLGTPWVATLAMGGLGIAACLAPLRLLLVLSGTGLVAIYAGVALAAIAGRRTGASAGAAYRMPLHPLPAIATLAALGWVVAIDWADPVDGRPGLIVTAAEVVLAIGLYAIGPRRRGWRAG